MAPARTVRDHGASADSRRGLRASAAGSKREIERHLPSPFFRAADAVTVRTVMTKVRIREWGGSVRRFPPGAKRLRTRAAVISMMSGQCQDELRPEAQPTDAASGSPGLVRIPLSLGRRTVALSLARLV